MVFPVLEYYQETETRSRATPEVMERPAPSVILWYVYLLQAPIINHYIKSLLSQGRQCG